MKIEEIHDAESAIERLTTLGWAHLGRSTFGQAK